MYTERGSLQNRQDAVVSIKKVAPRLGMSSIFVRRNTHSPSASLLNIAHVDERAEDLVEGDPRGRRSVAARLPAALHHRLGRGRPGRHLAALQSRCERHEPAAGLHLGTFQLTNQRSLFKHLYESRVLEISLKNFILIIKT